MNPNETLAAKIAADAKVTKLRNKLSAAEFAYAATVRAHAAATKPRIPDEPGSPGGSYYGNTSTAVITFVKTFNGSGVYHYAAIRPAGTSRWVITTASSTSTHGRKYTWAQLMDFVAEKESGQGSVALSTVAEWVKK